MKNWLPYLLLAAVLAVTVFAWTGYRQDTTGQRLFATHFDPVPETGYGEVRATAAVTASTEAEASLLRQLVKYHQRGQYAEALAASRALLETNPVTTDPRPYLLGGTAAVEIGQYETADYLLDRLPAGNERINREGAWYRALLRVRDGDLATAARLLDGIEPAPERVRRLRRGLATAAEDAS